MLVLQKGGREAPRFGHYVCSFGSNLGQNVNSRTDHAHKCDLAITLFRVGSPAYSLNVVRQGLTNVARTYRADRSDREKI